MSGVLKERRKDLGREISDIAQVTRIKGSYLRAIEDEDYEKLPVEVYTRGYIKEYAEFLGIPPGAALNPYERFLESKKAVKGKEHAAEKPLSTILQKENNDDLEIVRQIALSEDDETKLAFEEPKKSIISGKMLLALLVVVVAAIVYALIPRQGNIPIPPPQQEQPAKAPEAANPATPGLNGTQGTNVTGGTAPAPPQGQAAAPESSSAAKGNPPVVNDKAQEKSAAKAESGTAVKKKYNVDITATGRTWVQAIMDGSERRELMLNPGDKANFSGNKGVLLKVGNAAGVVLNFNGKELKNLGKEGEVVTINLPAPKPAQPAAPKKPAENSVNAPVEKKTPAANNKPEANTPGPVNNTGASAPGSPEAGPSAPSTP